MAATRVKSRDFTLILKTRIPSRRCMKSSTLIISTGGSVTEVRYSRVKPRASLSREHGQNGSS